MGSTLNPALERITYNTAVLKNCHQQTYQRLFVPFAGSPNSAFALKIASMLVEQKGSKIIFFHGCSSGKPVQDIEAFLEENVPPLGLDSSLFEPEYAVSRNLLKTLLKEAEQYDLVVISASQEKLSQQIAMEILPEEFTRRCQKPLVLVKASHPVKSFLKKWI